MINRTRRSFTALMLILSILLTTMPVSSVAVAAIDAEALSKESKIFNYIHREVFEENAHVQRLTAEESLDSYVFLNADGSRTAYFLDEQVKFVDANGTVQEKDITLTYAANTFSTTRNNVRLNIPTNLSTGVQLSYGGYDVSIVPQGSSLTLPRRTDNSVVYDNYFGTGTRLIYTPTLDGVKEDIVLTAYRGISSFTFLLNTDGLRVFHTAEDRWYLAEYEEAEMRFWLGNVEVYDANLKPSLGIMTVAPIIEGQRYRLTISADPNFLTDPATAYPVTIDPTITVSDTANGAGAIEDAPIYEGYPNSNFGSYIYDRAGYGGAAYKRGRTVVRLTGLLSNSTYSSLTALQLTSVKFYIADASGTAATNIYAHPLLSNSTWTESNVTWNNVGGYTTSSISASVGAGNYCEMDITALARMWKNGTFSMRHGFMLTGSNEGVSDRALYSCEHTTTAKRPYVTVNYSSSPAPTINLRYTNTDVDVGAILELPTRASQEALTINWSSSDTSVATVNDRGVVTGVKVGTAVITASASGATTKRCTVYVTIPDGVYHIQNKNSNSYASVGTGTMAVGNNVVQRKPLNGKDEHWEIKHLGSGQYSIRSDKSTSNFYMGVKDDAATNLASVVLRSAATTNGTKWKIAETANGNYTLTPLTGVSGNMVLATATQSTSNGVMLIQKTYTNDTSYIDEWDIYPVDITLNTPLFRQTESMWCWVTSAQMLVRTLYPSAANTSDTAMRDEQRAAVYHIFGNKNILESQYDWNTDPQKLKSQGGMFWHVGDAAKYYTSQSGAETAYTGVVSAYSEETILRFLRDGYPIARLTASFVTNVPKTYAVDDIPEIAENLALEDIRGHVTVITGYKWNPELECMEYYVNDPADTGDILQIRAEKLFLNTYSETSTTTTIEVWGFSVAPTTTYSHITKLYEAVVYYFS